MVTINLLTPRKLTVKATLAAIRAMRLTVRYRDGEYRIAYPLTYYAPSGRWTYQTLTKQEDEAYYTSDADDAIGTARDMVIRDLVNHGATLHRIQ